MLELFKKGLRNPSRVFYRWRQQLLRRQNAEVLAEAVTRRFHSQSSKIKLFFVKSQYDYGDKARGLSFEENNFLHCLINAGYDVTAFDPLVGLKRHGKKTMNKMLLEAVYRQNPDLVFCVLRRDEIYINTLLEIRDIMKIKTLNWFCDDQWRFDSFSKLYAPYFSYVITTEKTSMLKYKEIGYINVIRSQWGCNHFLYRKLDLPYKYDVSFVGQPHGDRPKIIKSLRNAGFDVATFGFGWPSGTVSTYEMIKIFNQTKINLNLSGCSIGSKDEIKGRDFEIPGSGGFMLTGHQEDLADFFSLGKEIVTYYDIPDLVRKIEYYLKNEEERELIRKRGHSRVLRDHTYTLLFAKMFDVVLNKHHDEKMPK